MCVCVCVCVCVEFYVERQQVLLQYVGTFSHWVSGTGSTGSITQSGDWHVFVNMLVYVCVHMHV